MNASRLSFYTRRYLALVALMLAGGSIYFLPYIRQSYHKPLMAALGVNNSELGYMNSVYGVTAMLCYFPGGWFADKFSARNLLTVSLVVTGCAGLWFSTFPSYRTVLFIHFIWGIFTILTFWAALVKATRLWGSDDSLGHAFGMMEGGCGIIESGGASLAVVLFSSFAIQSRGLTAVITTYSLISIIAGILVFCIIPKDAAPHGHAVPAAGPDGDPGFVARLRTVVKMKSIWLCTLVIFAAYAAFWGSYDFSLFASDGFGYDDIDSGVLSTFRMWFRPIAAIAAGFIADRISVPKAVRISFFIQSVSFAIFALMPTNNHYLWLLWLNTAIGATAAFTLRGIYFALLGSCRVPIYLTGTAVGVISLFAFTPDTINPLLTGWLFDTFPHALGHQYYYMILAVLCLVGSLAALAIQRITATKEFC